MTSATPTLEVAESGVPSAPPRGRVCMFVYNNCASDIRVHKEAKSLVEAGYEVQIVAVLDRKTVPVEDHPDGFRIVRIDRDPIHYHLLRRTRQIRRFMRLRKARLQRAARLTLRGVPRGPRRLARPSVSPSRITARAVGWLLALPAGLLASIFVGPGRLLRAVRWRLLRRFPALRKPYYRLRGLGGGSFRRRRYRQALKRSFAEGSWIPAVDLSPEPASRLAVPRDPAPALPRASTPPPARAPTPAPAEPVEAPVVLGRIRRFPAWIDRQLSRAAYRAVMTFHKPLMFSAYYRKAYKITRSGGFDVIHAHDLNTLPVAAFVARRGRCRLVYDAHELYPEISTLSSFERAVWRLLERLLISRVDVVITVCQSIADELSTRHRVAVPPTILLNCPSMIDFPSVEPGPNRLREKAGLTSSSEPIILYQGGFTPHRGLEELIKAVPFLERGILVLMGWGRIEPALRELIAELEVEDRVRIIDPVAQRELLSFTVGGDVGVIPYRAVGLNNYYTTPNKLFEYIVAGIPIAGSRVPELSRFIEGNGLGLTFDPDDPRDIALSLNFLLSDLERLGEMRGRSRQAARKYVWENEVRKLLSVYEDFGTDHALAPALPARRS